MNAFIIDDEPNAVHNLELLLRRYTPGVQVTATATSIGKAQVLLSASQPDILFLDIKINERSGFELLQQTAHCAVIFVTAYDCYSLQALKARAVDYLLKPVDIGELKTAVAKAEEFLSAREVNKHTLNDPLPVAGNVMPAAKLRHLTISGQQGFEVIPLREIVFIEGDGNYSVVYLTDMRKIVATRKVGELEDHLSGNGFFRIHKSAIINLQHLRSYDSREGHVARMSDGSSVAISGRRLGDFMKAVDRYAKEI